MNEFGLNSAQRDALKQALQNGEVCRIGPSIKITIPNLNPSAVYLKTGGGVQKVYCGVRDSSIKI